MKAEWVTVAWKYYVLFPLFFVVRERIIIVAFPSALIDAKMRL
jgi:hypothetical protein